MQFHGRVCKSYSLHCRIVKELIAVLLDHRSLRVHYMDLDDVSVLLGSLTRGLLVNEVY